MKKFLLFTITILFAAFTMSFSDDNISKKNTSFAARYNNNGGRTVTLCTISGYGPETEVNCNKREFFMSLVRLTGMKLTAASLLLLLTAWNLLKEYK